MDQLISVATEECDRTLHTNLLGHAVDIHFRDREVDRLLTEELGEFFGVGAAVPPEVPRLAAVHVGGSAGLLAAARSLACDPGHPILLHSGSHAYDLRRGTRHRAGDLTVIHCHETGSWVVSDPGRRRVVVCNEDARLGASDARRVCRDLLYLPWLEAHGAVVVHAAAVVDADGGVVLVVGDRGAGKTSLFMAAARHGWRRALSCERSILLPQPGGIRVLACPERISTFPGTLRAFPETEHLAGDRREETEWKRPGKRRVPWREMFSCLGLEPALDPVHLSRIVFPAYSAEGPSRSEALTAEQTWYRLLDHVVTGRSAERPDWLGWFAPAHTARTVRAVTSVPARAGTWSDLAGAAALIHPEEFS